MSQQSRTRLNFGALLFFLYFVTLLGGRFSPARLGDLPDFDVRSVLTPLALLLTLVWLLGEGRRSVGGSRYLGFFFAYMGVLALSVSWSPDSVDSSRHLIDILHLAAQVGGALIVAARLPTSTLTRIWSWFVAAGVTYLIGGIAVGLVGQARISAFGGGPNTFVRVMTVAAIGVLFTSMSRRTSRLIALLPMFVAGAVLSGSRGGLLATLIAFGVGVLPSLRLMDSLLRQRLVLGTFAGGLLVYATLWDTVRASFERRIVRLTFEQRYDSIRGELFASALDLWRTRPFFGVGVGGFDALTPYNYPHNMTIATAAETGVFGVVVLLLLVTYSGKSALGARLSPHGLASLLAFAAIFVASQFSGDYFDSRFAWLFLGLAVIEAQRARAAALTLQPRSRSSMNR